MQGDETVTWAIVEQSLYKDFGPVYVNRGTWAGSTVLRSEYANRPHCDLCGPFRGSRLRLMPSGEWRCKGCDEEDS
jgi:hypothetical protein